MRISYSELEEIKPLGTTPPPVPNDAAEHFDLEDAMKSALESAPPPPAPTIDPTMPPSGATQASKSKSKSKSMPRWVQASVALLVGAAAAWVIQSSTQPDPEPSVTPVAERPVLAPPAPAAPQSESEALPADESTDEVVASIFDEEAPPARDVATAEAEVERAAPPRRETNANLPADYDTPEARAEREADRADRRSAEEHAATVAEAEAAAEAARSELPGHPDRDAVRDAMEQVRPAIEQCANGQHGTAQLHITVHHSGRVQGARVEGIFAGPEGSCMALAARRARFPRFSEDRFSLTYPFTF